MIRILIDQGLPATAAALLREDGWDAIHLRDIAMSKAGDHEVLDCAPVNHALCLRIGACRWLRDQGWPAWSPGAAIAIQVMVASGRWNRRVSGANLFSMGVSLMDNAVIFD